MVRTIITDNLNLDQIADSGQVFRWKKLDVGRYLIPSGGHETEACQSGNELRLTCSGQDEPFWRSYFDLETDYGEIIRSCRLFHDTYLDEAMAYGSGIRIIRQDLWETVVTFLISQNNNIPRIRKIIDRLCRACGHFPAASEILQMDLSDKGLGYRDKYLKNAAQCFQNGMHDCFCSICGVGPKVESCIRLYGCHELSYAPVDTWIKRVISEDYDGRLPEWMTSPYAGVCQQYVFYYKRKTAPAR